MRLGTVKKWKSKIIDNYTKDHSFIWDEIWVPITYDSNWKEAHDKILEAVKKETRETTKEAEKSISKLGEKYYLQKRIAEPAIFVRLTDNWISMNVRYMTEAGNRRALQNKLSQEIISIIGKSKRIRISSTTSTLSGSLDIRMAKGRT